MQKNAITFATTINSRTLNYVPHTTEAERLQTQTHSYCEIFSFLPPRKLTDHFLSNRGKQAIIRVCSVWLFLFLESNICRRYARIIIGQIKMRFLCGRALTRLELPLSLFFEVTHFAEPSVVQLDRGGKSETLLNRNCKLNSKKPIKWSFKGGVNARIVSNIKYLCLGYLISPPS